MSETSDSGSGSFKASFVTVNKLAFERVSMAECIMGSHTSSMFGITNIFCEMMKKTKKKKQGLAINMVEDSEACLLENHCERLLEEQNL